MARDHARTRLSIAEDDDLESLSADAQWLYFRVLLPEVSLSQVGIADWRPNRLVGKARDMTLGRLLDAAAELEHRRYTLFDLATDEALIRSYVRVDELLRNPKMAAAVVKAYRCGVSKALRAAIVTECRRVRTEHPEYSSWEHKDTADDLAGLLSRPGADAVPYTNCYSDRITNRIANAVEGWITDAITNGNTHRKTDTGPGADNQPDNQPDNQSDSVPIPTHLAPHTPHPTPSTNRETKPGTAPAADQQRHHELNAEVETRLAAIALCRLCDTDGYRLPDSRGVCDHRDRSAVAAAGVARARDALKAAGADRPAHQPIDRSDVRAVVDAQRRAAPPAPMPEEPDQ